MSTNSDKSDTKILSVEDIGHGLTEYKFAVQVRAATFERLPLEEVESDLICGITDTIVDTIKDNLGIAAVDIRFVELA